MLNQGDCIWRQVLLIQSYSVLSQVESHLYGTLTELLLRLEIVLAVYLSMRFMKSREMLLT